MKKLGSCSYSRLKKNDKEKECQIIDRSINICTTDSFSAELDMGRSKKSKENRDSESRSLKK